jgi:hypothetical protein
MFVRVGVCDPTREDQPPYKYKWWWPIDDTKLNLSIHLLFMFYLTFPIYYFLSFFIVDDVHCFSDGEALERSGQLWQPIATARPDGFLPCLWGFGSQETSPACLAYHASFEAPFGDVSCVSRSQPGHTVTCSCANNADDILNTHIFTHA